MPVEGSYESFKATVLSLIDHRELYFAGASVTIPHKEHLGHLSVEFNPHDKNNTSVLIAGNGPIAQNTLELDGHAGDIPLAETDNTDEQAIYDLITLTAANDTPRVLIAGAGGVAEAAARASRTRGAKVSIAARTSERAEQLIERIQDTAHESATTMDTILPEQVLTTDFDIYINCTPVGMTGGPDPDGLSIPIPDMPNLSPDTVFFDTVYNPIETPMLKAAKERGYRTIDGVQMFIKQAAAQFSIWTGQAAPEELFDRLVRSKLGA
jgi:3-dehydroquinate dehydratase/shikimate dehydrogenase